MGAFYHHLHLHTLMRRKSGEVLMRTEGENKGVGKMMEEKGGSGGRKKEGKPREWGRGRKEN